MSQSTHNQPAMPVGPPWREGLDLGLKRCRAFIWFLLKTILPLYVATELLRVSGVLAWLSGFLAPVMGWWGLPAEAAAVLTAGMLVNLYAAAAVAAPLGLSAGQITLLGLILGISHQLVVEGAIVRKLAPGRGLSLTLLRLGLGLAAGWLVSQVVL